MQFQRLRLYVLANELRQGRLLQQRVNATEEMPNSRPRPKFGLSLKHLEWGIFLELRRHCDHEEADNGTRSVER